jgi:phosphomannomutase
MEQMTSVWPYLSCQEITLMPCNGTKIYKWKKAGFNSRFVLQSEMSMIEEIGDKNYSKVVEYLFMRQFKFMKNEVSINCTGNFFSYRGSMLNWCPVGRSGKDINRSNFVEFDKKERYREKEIKKLTKFIKKNKINLSVALGGDTSFDMFPKGWNKTIALKDMGDKDLYFFGDRCSPGGNDFEIYEEVKNRGGKSYHVKNPEETAEILKAIIKRK